MPSGSLPLRGFEGSFKGIVGQIHRKVSRTLECADGKNGADHHYDAEEILH